MLKIGDVFEAVAMLHQLQGRYQGNPQQVVCDLLTLIAGAAYRHGVKLEAMLDAVRQGAQAAGKQR